jgi:hypothetical protein
MVLPGAGNRTLAMAGLADGCPWRRIQASRRRDTELAVAAEPCIELAAVVLVFPCSLRRRYPRAC